jgi:uracil phosphoribosyltransferase
MLATGGSAIAAATFLKRAGVTHIRFVCLVAAPEGIAAFHSHHTEIPIYTAAVDRQLNEKGYILPGLGDAGDRIFGT